MTTTGTTGRPRPAKEQDLARQFSALGESKRLGILESLAAEDRCACDLKGCCDDRQPLLSFHLKKLRETGLVHSRRDGRWIHYSLDREALRRLAEHLVAIADGELDGPGRC
ncbi:MAG: metalloregulator ArsR/SmtB family transcription factor [Gemmatimonadota bacterium]|nr:metalloregulator ArsR/SmtB family transcription factor [Gemmatimonadota bacterium]